jgi:hypothetical protein
LKGLFLEFDFHSILAQFARSQVNFEDPEVNNTWRWLSSFHTGLTSSRSDTNKNSQADSCDLWAYKILEHNLQAKLYLAGLVGRVKHRTKIRTAEVAFWEAIFWRVESVKHFYAELHALRFSQWKLTEDGEIEVLGAIATQTVSSQISESKELRKKRKWID